MAQAIPYIIMAASAAIQYKNTTDTQKREDGALATQILSLIHI